MRDHAPRPNEADEGLALVDQVRQKGIRDPAVLDAIARTPRARFLPAELRTFSTADRPLPIGCDQTISQPYIVALMTAELALSGGDRVLEIGTGSGYQTAILAALAGSVHTIERHPLLSLRARAILDGLGITNVSYRVGDGTIGWPGAAPFDRVLIAAAAPRLPRQVFEQVIEGGRIVIPLGDATEQRLTLIEKVDGRAVHHQGTGCRFVPLIGVDGWDEPRPA